MYKIVEEVVPDLKDYLDIPPEGMGDVSITCFEPAKKEGISPMEYAKRVASKLKHDYIDHVDVVGGYVNVFFKKDKVLTYSYKPKLEGKIVLEHTSVNPMKPWHIGHARNACLGDTMSRVLRYVGYDVEVQNYINDVGKQMAMVVWYLSKHGLDADKKYDHWLGEIYIKANSLYETDATVKQQVDSTLKLIEQGDNPIAKFSRNIAEKCLASQLDTASKFNINYDLFVWESDVIKSGLFDRVMSDLKSKGLVRVVEHGEDKGCTVVDIPEAGLKTNYKILVRSNGTATYTAKDLAMELWRFGYSSIPVCNNSYKHTCSNGELYTPNADKIVLVISNEQDLQQKIIRHILRSIGINNDYIHLSYNTVVLPGGKFSGRSGNWQGYEADTVLEKAVKKIRDEVRQKYGSPEKVAEKIAHGAVKFFLAKYNPRKQIVFDWDKVLSFEGESSVYIQYAAVRAKKIMDKADFESKVSSDLDDVEYSLAKHISLFGHIVEDCAKEMSASKLAEYLVSLADRFNRFYEKCPVLTAEESKKHVRLYLVQRTYETLKQGLSLFGIEIPEFM